MENLNALLEYGPMGVIASVSMYQTWVMTKKLFTIVQEVTTVLTQLQMTISKCELNNEK